MTRAPLPRRHLAVGAAALLLAPAAQAAAPQRGGQAPGWYRFRIGAFECTVLSDGALNLGAPHPTFGGTRTTAEEVQAELRRGFLPTAALSADLNCIAVNTGRELVLLDAGVGPQPAFGPGSGRLGAALAAAGIAPAEVDVVAFTHAHPDHVWGIADAQGQDVFPNARFALTAPDLAFWTDEANLNLPAPWNQLVAGTRAIVLPRRPRFETLGPSAEVVPGIRAVPSPGHTSGHVCFHIESEGERLLVMGDVANHHVLAVARTDWPFEFDADQDLAIATRRRILGMAATDRTQVLGYHFPWPGLGHVETAGAGFRFTPSPWRWG